MIRDRAINLLHAADDPSSMQAHNNFSWVQNANTALDTER